MRLVVALGRRDQVDLGVEHDHRPLQIVQRGAGAPVVVRLVILQQRAVEHEPAPLPSSEEVTWARREGGAAMGVSGQPRARRAPARATLLRQPALLGGVRSVAHHNQSEQAVPLRPREVALFLGSRSLEFAGEIV